MEIRKAALTELDAVNDTYLELFAYEEKNGTSTNWVPGLYPTATLLEQSCKAGTLYVAAEQGRICAGMILNQEQAKEYEKIRWACDVPPEQVLVIHTLCIAPSQAGRGIGSDMVRFAEELARGMHCLAVRLDTWEGNRPAAALYTKLGYRCAGKAEVLFQGLIPENLIYFEKNLNG